MAPASAPGTRCEIQDVRPLDEDRTDRNVAITGEERVPLLALVDGVRTVSILLTDDEWLTLQAASRQKAVALTLPCGLPGHLRTSKLGTRHFAHNPGGGGCADHIGETAQHLLAKSIIVRAAAAAGWTATPEYRGNGWVADVLAEKDGRCVAFEVQWSPQTRDDYQHRQDRYAADGVRCAWFTRHEHSIPPPTKDLPVFYLAEDRDDMTVRIAARTMPLADAVTALLRGHVKYRDYVSNGESSETSILLHETECWKCHAPFLIWNVEGSSITGPCGQWAGVSDGYEIFATDRPEAASAIRAAATRAANGQPLPLATLSPRYTKMSESTYMAFSCPKCGYVYGDMFVHSLIANSAYESPYRAITQPGTERGIHEPHWCYDTGQGHCALPPPGYIDPKSPTDEAHVGTVQVQRVGDGLTGRQAVNRMFGGSFY
jgi:competence protein CoiA